MRLQPSESQIVSACIRFLWAHGIKARRQNTGAYKPEGSSRFIRFGKPGAGDIICCMPPDGRYLEIEVKSAKGKQTPMQKQHQQEIEAAGGIYILARSIDDLQCLISAPAA